MCPRHGRARTGPGPDPHRPTTREAAGTGRPPPFSHTSRPRRGIGKTPFHFGACIVAPPTFLPDERFVSLADPRLRRRGALQVVSRHELFATHISLLCELSDFGIAIIARNKQVFWWVTDFMFRLIRPPDSCPGHPLNDLVYFRCLIGTPHTVDATFPFGIVRVAVCAFFDFLIPPRAIIVES